MASGRVLVIGLDPTALSGWDPKPVAAAIRRGETRFAELGIDVDTLLIAVDDDAEKTIAEALTRIEYACVVIGGGIRKHEPYLEFFEKVVNLVRLQAPGAAIAFNSTPEDAADAAVRGLRQQ
ncbi:hypothetical protein COUCH_26605 [Couchioplanes caeruleus]|uniref:hypothetical protein n=1 Tax=Couchioplanes caeruleus TaxID=56438 RepID=UPI0020BE8297|nr:hypothetical protein [Couchioplanes caeruleus]UQU62587.1 hypothetical protein COUCH_26605 [Couchioplanes caeruleus]